MGEMKTFFLCVSLMLSSCALFVDLSPQTLHKRWVGHAHAIVGKSIFNCIDSSPCYQYRGGGAFQGDNALSNGNKEAAYFMPYIKHPKCRYFFEYEPTTGLIVGFRFEESEPFACRITGA
jgi:hypothetical protein